MNKKLYELLLELEDKFPMEIHEPASKNSINKLKEIYPTLPVAVLDMLEISNGIEINVPGTVLYSVEDIISHNERGVDEYVIGYMSFGDEIHIDKSGMVIQIDHETEEVFLEWESLEECLAEELHAFD